MHAEKQAIDMKLTAEIAAMTTEQRSISIGRADQRS
jgi:hypothetical protein